MANEHLIELYLEGIKTTRKENRSGHVYEL